MKPPKATRPHNPETRAPRRPQPAAPPVYRPQPVPKVLQPKAAPAPPVYRPQPTPKVLQTKSALTQPRAGWAPPPKPPAAPPVYRPHPAPAVLQKKGHAHPNACAHASSPPPPRSATARTHSAPKRPDAPRCAARVMAAPARAGTIQRSSEKLQRTDFWTDTKKEITLSSGEHRRHIISNHLMKSALQAWWDAHDGTKERDKTSFSELQNTLDEMNNYQPNLIPGPGAENTAIGMITNNAARKIESFVKTNASPMDMETSFGKYSGFQQNTQKQLLGPVLSTFTQDTSVSQSHESALSFAKGIMDSTDFDWPEGADASLYDDWHKAYLSFISLRSNAKHYPYEGLSVVVKTFLSLKKPTA